jgi:hypothetical protein
MQTIDGARLHAYRVDDVANHAMCTAYLDAPETSCA